jgi:cellulose synthase/poly-beta-1,6-N-acetylglucosamine synthase-like glycosyltransferase
MKIHWKYKRLFEILPAVLSWTILITPIILAFTSPKALAVVLLTYLSFWLLRTLLMSYHLIDGYRHYKEDIGIDWLKKLERLPDDKKWQDIYHVIIVPEYKEPIEILRSSVESVIGSNYPKENIIYVLATEERDNENADRDSKILIRDYKSKLRDYLRFEHPKDIPGEIIGKGPNITNAGKEVAKYIAKKRIKPENVIITTMDADNRVDKNYLACLSYKYITDPDPVHKSYQPLPMYFNNIWDVPMAMRLIAMGSSSWQLIVSTKPTRLRNFSAHAQSLETLERVDFWSTRSIVEDGHQYWRSFFKLNGRHACIALYTPVYQDAVLAGGLIKTIKEQYLQKRRWSWGVSDIPYVMEHTFRDKKILWLDRWANVLLLWEAHISWATASLLLATSAWLPLVFSPSFKRTIMSYNFPIIYSRLLAIAWIGMIITLVISTLLVPPRDGRKPRKRIAFDWILTPIMLPVTNVFLSGIPALVSQTMLAFGRYLEYRTTVKSTKRSNI